MTAPGARGGGIGLTPRQRDLLLFVQNYIAERGYPPTYREIMAGVDLSSTAQVFRLVYALIERGRLRQFYGSLQVIHPLDVTIRGERFRFIPVREPA